MLQLIGRNDYSVCLAQQDSGDGQIIFLEAGCCTYLQAVKIVINGIDNFSSCSAYALEQVFGELVRAIRTPQAVNNHYVDRRPKVINIVGELEACPWFVG